MKPLRVIVAGVVLLFAPVVAPSAEAQQSRGTGRGCEELFRFSGIVYRGSAASMTLQTLASYAAPVFWLSPDEPTMQRQRGPAIRVPAAFPFEAQPDSPVIYYEATFLAQLPNSATAAIQIDASDKGASILNFDAMSALTIKYIAYFPQESGVGEHPHDVEPTELRLVIGRANGPLARRLGYNCDSTDYLVVVARATGEAHGNPWYYNVMEVDPETVLPIHILVEEGKHGMATDRNADGYYTPGYDVSFRMNDAWGVRDTIRGGNLFTGSFEGWMAKVRRPEHRVLPPLPVDSQLHARLADLGEVPSANAVYVLRPYPTASLASADALLQQKIKEKEVQGWPKVETSSDPFNQFRDALQEGRSLRPFSVAIRADQQIGLAIAFPLLIVKNVQESIAGGYIVNRMYFKDEHFRDFGWMVMYTPSASRWLDKYAAVGIEVDRGVVEATGGETKKSAFMFEAGVKFRFRAPNRAFGLLTNFWGIRAGIKGLGGLEIDRLSYVFEFGAGAW